MSSVECAWDATETPMEGFYSYAIEFPTGIEPDTVEEIERKSRRLGDRSDLADAATEILTWSALRGARAWMYQ